MIFTTATYLIGIGALLLVDVLATKAFPPEAIARWAEVRALVGISGVICLVGLEQVLVRSRQSSARLLSLIGVQVPLLGLGVGSAIWWFGYLGYWLTGVLLAIGSGMTMAFVQYFRSHHQRLLAQISEQGWKITVFAVVVGLVASGARAPLDEVAVASMFLVLAVSGAMLLRHPPGSLYPQTPEPLRVLYAIGVRFWVSSLMLALAVYAEQLVVNGFGSAQQGALYFTHATFFLFPISVVNGYLAFLIGPWARDNHDRFLVLLRRHAWALVAVATLYAVAANLVGVAAWRLIGPSVGDPDPLLRGIFLVSCIARTLYTFPSAYVGVFGKPRQHDRLIAGQVAILLAVAAAFSAAYRGNAAELVHIVAALSAANWVLRTALGYGVTNVVARSRA